MFKNFVKKSHVVQTKGPIVLYNHAKNWEILGAVLKKRPKSSKNGYLIPYNTGLIIFRKKNWVKRCTPLSITIMQKIEKILRALLEKTPKTLKNGHLFPYDTELRIFEKSHLAQTMCNIVLYNHAKNLEDP